MAQPGSGKEAGFAARCLMRGASSATLATAAAGQPFASLVTPAVAPDGSVLLWLSALSEHTRQLAAEPRCALLFAGAPAERNPQTAPRVSVTGLAERVEDAGLKRRWLDRHPYAALYAEFADFSLWQVRPGGALLVGGFATAIRLRAADLLPDEEAVSTVAAAESDILERVNADHPDAPEAIAAGLLGGAPGPWRLSAADVDGVDLALGEDVRRFHFVVMSRNAVDVRDTVMAAARDARTKLVSASLPR